VKYGQEYHEIYTWITKNVSSVLKVVSILLSSSSSSAAAAAATGYKPF